MPDPAEARLDALLAALERLGAFREELGEARVERWERALAEARARRDRQEAVVAVVGEKKAGKSTFLNAILGGRLLGTAVREHTGAVTSLRRGPARLVVVRRAQGGLPPSETAVPDPAVTGAVAPPDAPSAEVIFEGAAPEARPLRRGGRPPSLATGRRTAAAGLASAPLRRLVRGARGVAWRPSPGRPGAALATAASSVGRRAVSRDLRERDVSWLGRGSPVPAGAGSPAHPAPPSAPPAWTALQEALRRADEAVEDAEAALAAGRRGVLEAGAALAAVGDVPAYALAPVGWWSTFLGWVLGWWWRRRITRRAEAVAALEDARRRGREAWRRTEAAYARRSEAARAFDVALDARLSAVTAYLDARDVLIEAERRRLDRALAGVATRTRRRGWLDAAGRWVGERAARLVDLRGDADRVERVELSWPEADIPRGLVLLDTPGVNTGTSAALARAWRAIEEDADGCVLLSDLQQAASRTTLGFLARVAARVPHVSIVLTKVDKALAGAEDPAEVEEAASLAVRRFAEALGRAPDEVRAWRVAAEPALRELDCGVRGPGVRALGEAVRELRAQLLRDRRRMLVERAERIAAEAAGGVDEVVAQALAGLEARLVVLDAQAIPDPAAWRAAVVEPALDDLALAFDGLAGSAEERVRGRLGLARAAADRSLAALSGAGGLRAWREQFAADHRRFAAELGEGLARDWEERRRAHVARHAGRVAADFERRWQVLAAGAVVVGEASTERVAVAGVPVVGIAEVVPALGAAGAGALIGSLVLPGLGTAIGAGVGLLVGYLGSGEVQRGELARSVDTWFAETEASLLGWITTRRREDLARAVGGIEAFVDAELSRLDGWIRERRAAEEAARAAVLARLAGLSAAAEDLRAARAGRETGRP